MILRYDMIRLTLDVEHFSKVNLLNRIEQEGEDGYSVVADFLVTYDRPGQGGRTANCVKDNIERGKSSPYVEGILRKWPQFDFPVWVFLELVPFGTFTYIYKFCGDRFADKGMRDQFYLLQYVKSMRNACAHNNCILNELRSGKPMYKPGPLLTNAVSRVEGIGKSQRKAKLSNDRLLQIATTLYVHSRISSQGAMEHRSKTLSNLVERMNRHKAYYNGNDQITTLFDFISKLVAAWYPASEPRADGV